MEKPKLPFQYPEQKNSNPNLVLELSMHIAILSDPNNFHTRKWARALALAGAKVTVFSFEAEESGGLHVSVPGRGDLEQALIECVQVKPLFRRKGKYSYLSYLYSGEELGKELDRRNVDIVNALNITPFGVWALQTGRKPLIASALGADILEYPPGLELSPALKQRSWDNVEGSVTGRGYGLKRRFHRGQVEKVLRYADLVTGDNQTLLDCMRDWFRVDEQRMKLLRWGVEPELFESSETEQERVREQFGIQKGETVILSPRGAKAVYQGDIIIDAFERLLANGYADCRFIMLGAGYEVANNVEWRALALEKQYPNFRFVREQIPRETVALLWKEVDVFVSAPVYDGYSASLAEGRYVGAVPLVNDIPATRELIRHGENGWIVDPFTAEGLAKALEQVLKDLPEVKNKFGPTNRKWIEAHSMQSTSAEMFLQWCELLIT